MSLQMKQVFVRELYRALEGIGVAKHGSMRYVSKLCKVSPSAVSKWFNDEVVGMPQLHYLALLAQHTNTSLDQLLLGKDDSGIPIVQGVDGSSGTLVCDGGKLGVPQGALAYRMPDNSMQALGASPDFPKGTLVIFSPNQAVKHGDYVCAIAWIGGEQMVVCRQYLSMGSMFYLAPINPHYPRIDGDFEVIGVVIRSVCLLQ